MGLDACAEGARQGTAHRHQRAQASTIVCDQAERVREALCGGQLALRYLLLLLPGFRKAGGGAHESRECWQGESPRRDTRVLLLLLLRPVMMHASHHIVVDINSIVRHNQTRTHVDRAAAT